MLSAVLASVVSMESLLFIAVQEQQYDTDCAQVVVESIGQSYWVTPVEVSRESPSGDFSMSVMEIHTVLNEIGLTNNAYWLDWKRVLLGTSQFGPVIVHLEKPQGHFAIALGEVDSLGELLLLGDPARGTIIVSRSWWNRHASGAAVVIEAEGRRDAVYPALDNGYRRWKKLERLRNAL